MVTSHQHELVVIFVRADEVMIIMMMIVYDLVQRAWYVEDNFGVVNRLSNMLSITNLVVLVEMFDYDKLSVYEKRLFIYKIYKIVCVCKIDISKLINISSKIPGVQHKCLLDIWS